MPLTQVVNPALLIDHDEALVSAQTHDGGQNATPFLQSLFGAHVGVLVLRVPAVAGHACDGH